MSRLIQYQRIALEQVVKDDIPTNDFILEAEQEYFLNNSVVFLAGISDKIDICANRQGIYVAVFTKNSIDRGRVQFLDPKQQLKCRGAVLLRDREQREFSSNIHPSYSSSSVEAIDGLRVLHKVSKPNRIFFRQNGKSTLYTVLI